jgi:hypothetical protein
MLKKIEKYDFATGFSEKTVTFFGWVIYRYESTKTGMSK